MRLTRVLNKIRAMFQGGRVAGAWELWVRTDGVGRRARQKFRRVFRRSLVMEGLETRRALAFSIASSGTSVTLTGTTGDDAVAISVSTGGYFQHDLPVSGNLVSSIDTNGTLAGEQAIVASSVSAITVTADVGNDTIDASAWTGVGITVYGGDGNDVIKGGAGNDRFWGDGGDDVIHGGAGIDDLRGGDGDDTLEGNEGTDYIDFYDRVPRIGNDTLRGGDGDDYLAGNSIFDQIYGGIGSDMAISSEITHVTLSDLDYTSSGVTSANHGVERWELYGTNSDDSIDASAWTGIGLLVLGYGGNDVINGGAGNDDLRGGEGNDTLEGNGGTDYLDWNDSGQRIGNDILRGGEGDDQIAGDSPFEQFYGGNGNDRVIASGIIHATLSDSDYTTSGLTSAGHSIERWDLSGTNGDDSIDASAWTGIGLLVFGYGGNDVIKGGAGNDDLRGGEGNDTLEGNGGTDYLDWSDSGQRIGNDILRGGEGDDYLAGDSTSDQFYGGSGSDRVGTSGVTQITLSDLDYTSSGVTSAGHGVERWELYGTNSDDSIDASAWTGNGLLVYGFAGNDIIKGGAGNDDLRGGAGDDILEGNGGTDYLEWNDGSQRSGNDILRGGEGDDYLAGDSNSDQFYGGSGSDTVSTSGVTQVTLSDLDYTSSGVTSAGHGVERWDLYGTNSDDSIDASAWTGSGLLVYGFGGNDIIKGGAGNDDLRGGEGNDTLEGNGGTDYLEWNDGSQRSGNDILRGGEGDDYLAGDSNSEQFYGGNGNDMVYASGVTQVTLSDLDYTSSGVTSAGHGVERWELYGTNSDDSIDASAWTGNGLRIYGYGGNDVLKGGAGNDDLRGDDGNDDITGGGGQDYLNGQSGNDTIRVPNSSFSQVIGEAGLDRFIVNSAGVAVNLVANSTSYMQGIEEIDLTGMGNNSLILNQSRVLTLSDSTDTLIVMGNPGDSLTNDAGWTTTGTETINGALYKVQTNGAATLKVQQATDVRIEREIQQFNYAFDNANSDGFSGTFALAGVQNYQGLGNTGNTFNASFLKSSNSATLTLNNLPDHDAIELDFLLAIIDSWDGGTSDYFNILIDGTTVFRESFSVFDSANQSYSPPPGGRVSFGSNLGFSSWVDAAYDMSNETRLQRIPHSGSSLTIAWQANGPGWEAGDNESWAIDNLKVTLWGSQFAVPDNLAAGEYIGNLTTTDIDPTNSFTYALTSGSGDTDNAYFSIVGNELRTALPLIPSKSSYSIRMRATDNAGIPFDKVLLVQVIPSNQSPSDIALSNLSIAENADPNSLIGSFSTTDPNEGDTFTYSLVSGTGDSDNAAFTIDGTSLRAVNSFDFETKSSYSIRVRSTDQGDLWTEKVFTISVTNVNESPTDIALSSTSIAENNLANAAVGSLSTTDVDASNSFTYSLVPGAGDSDNGAFSIDGSTLRANSSFDFESKPSYSVRIRSTDQGGLFFEKDFTINVTDLDENRYFDGLAAADSFIASYTGDGIQAAWTLTRNGVALFNGSIPNGGALVINALAGADTLQVNGRAVDDLLTFDANRITVNNAPVLFSNTEIVKLLAGLGNDQMIFVTPAASGVSLFYDGGTGTDRVETLTGSNIWNVTGAGIGNVNSKLTFLAAETLVGGSGDDQFILANAGKVTGQILGGTGNDTLNLAAKTTAHTINLQSNTATSTGGIGSIESFIGGNTATVTDVLIGPNVATSWSIDGINAGSVSNATLGSVAFSGFESLTGGTAADSFVITNAGNITKTLTGGTAIGIIDTLDLSAKTAALDFRLDATASSVPNSVGSYVGFETITGNSVAGSKVTRVNNTTTAWAVDTLGQIVVNSVTYRNVPGIAGGIGADTLTGPALTGTDVSTWTLDSAGGGTLAIPGISIAFSGMNNLTGGTGADAFEVLPAGSLSGAINGGTGTGINSLSYAQWTSNVSVNLAVTTVANATAIAGLTSNIQMVTGGAGNDTLQGQAAKSTVLVGLAGNDTLIGGSQRDLLFGGLGVDNISGVGGDDLIVSGTTSYDTNRTALLGIVAEWISTRTFAVRTANIWGNGSGTRNNGIYFLNSDPSDAITDTVFADADLDSLMGGLNQDWFFSSASESLDFVGTGATPDRRNG